MTKLIKKEEEILKIRESGKIASKIIKRLKAEARADVATLSLEDLARSLLKEYRAKPAFLGYRPEGSRRPYPYAICTSINEGVVHGLPSTYRLKSGDVLKIDLGVDFQGGISDMAVTIPIGKVAAEGSELIKATFRALGEAIRVTKAGHTVGDIGFAIERIITSSGFKVIESLTGHGVGGELHEDPVIYNYGKPGSGLVLKEGMVLAIEPITSLGTTKVLQLNDDSFITADRSIAAHFEHTVLITKKGAEILTA